VEVEEGLWELVARGLVSADGFGAVRALFSRRESWQRGRRLERRRRLGARRAPALRHGGDGRWALLPAAANDVEFEDPEELAEQVAGQLLARWGVVFHDLLARETLAVPWRELHWALRRLEARGLVRGGRFVNGFAGEQYALVEAVDALRRARRSPRSGELVHLSAADPLNISGVLPGSERVPALRKRSIDYLDGALAPEPGGRKRTVHGTVPREPAIAAGERG
jgi:ATP-dependent Lhr-like helicase